MMRILLFVSACLISACYSSKSPSNTSNDINFLLQCFIIHIYLNPLIKNPCTYYINSKLFFFLNLTVVDTCRDNYDNCKSLGKVACENLTVFTWVFHNCAMTCDLCSKLL